MKERPPNRLIADDDESAPKEGVAHDGGLNHRAKAGERDAGRVSSAPARRVSDEDSPTRRRSQGQGPYPGRRQVTAHIDRQLFLWLKRISAETDKPMVEIFEEALSDFVNSYAAKLKFGDKG